MSFCIFFMDFVVKYSVLLVVSTMLQMGIGSRNTSRLIASGRKSYFELACFDVGSGHRYNIISSRFYIMLKLQMWECFFLFFILVTFLTFFYFLNILFIKTNMTGGYRSVSSAGIKDWSQNKTEALYQNWQLLKQDKKTSKTVVTTK